MADRLRGEHDAALRDARVGTGKKVYDYGVTFNGFAARLTAAEVARLKARPGRAAGVEERASLQADTITTPTSSA